MEKEEFLAVIENFLKKNNIAASTFGKKTINDQMLVFHLRKGRECLNSTQKKVLKFMEEYERSQSNATEFQNQ